MHITFAPNHSSTSQSDWKGACRESDPEHGGDAAGVHHLYTHKLFSVDLVEPPCMPRNTNSVNDMLAVIVLFCVKLSPDFLCSQQVVIMFNNQQVVHTCVQCQP